MSDPIPESIGRLTAAPDLVELAHALKETGAVTASGLWGSSVAAVVSAVRKELRAPVMLICGHLDEADDLADDIELFLQRRPEVLPALELSGSLGRVSEEQVANRLKLVSRLVAKPDKDLMLVAPIQALMQSVPARDQLQHLVRTLNTGDDLEPEKLIVWLSDHGYNRLDQVEVPGDFAVRGGIIDIYLPGDFEQEADQIGLAVRIDFFDDQIESIKKFDLDKLGSGEALPSIRIMDLKGQLPETSGSTNLFTYLDPETIVVLWAPLEIAEQAKSYLERLPDERGIYPLASLLQQAGHFPRLELSQFDQGTTAMPTLVGGHQVEHVALPVGSRQRFETEAKKAIKELEELSRTHDVTVFCENEGEVNRFKQLVDQDAPGLSSRIQIPTGYLHRGFVYDPNQSDEATKRRSDEGETNRGASSDPSSLRRFVASSLPLALLGHHE